MQLVDAGELRVLDFDIENRPLAYMGQDFTTGEVTAIACSWIGGPEVYCWALGEVEPEIMLQEFVKLYNEADEVTGHYICGHDLPVLNGALLELGLPGLASKLTSDTHRDLVRTRHLSRSQENLAEMWDLAEEKYHMNNTRWRRANRLTPVGIRQTKKRVMDDVIQHMELRAKMIELGVLGVPRVWRP